MSRIAFFEAREHWDLAAALRASKPGNLFPSRVAWSAVQDNGQFLTVLDGHASAGFDVGPVELVPVPKMDGTTRPAADMRMEDQVLYAALVHAVRSRLHRGLVEFTGEEHSYLEFETFPLMTDESPAYVLSADVVSFYEYIDHDVLAYELLGLTGLAETPDSLTDLLKVWLGSTRGLPQGPASSQPLADIYLSRASRTLARAGFEHSRYVDDFRVPVSSWGEALRAKLVLEQSLRSIELALSASKVWILKAETYKRWLARIPRNEQADPNALEHVGFDPDAYGGSSAYVLDVSADDAAQALEIFEEQIAKRQLDLMGTRRMRWALPRLAYSESIRPIAEFSTLMRRYGHITQTVAIYLQLLMGSDLEGSAVEAVLDWIETAGFRFEWQVGWLLHAMIYTTEQSQRLAAVSEHILADDSLPWFVRGQAALALATERALPDQQRYFDIYERAPAATQPDLLGAVVVGRPRWGSAFIKGASTTPLLAAVAELEPAEYFAWV